MDTYTVRALTSRDLVTVERIATNLRDYRAGKITIPEACGIFSVNLDELLHMIASITAPAEPARPTGTGWPVAS